MARHAARETSTTAKRVGVASGVVMAVAAVATVLALTVGKGGPSRTGAASLHHSPTTTSTSSTTTTTTTTPATTPTTTLPPPGPGFMAGHVTAIGDSVRIDYEAPLRADIPGVAVQ